MNVSSVGDSFVDDVDSAVKVVFHEVLGDVCQERLDIAQIRVVIVTNRVHIHGPNIESGSSVRAVDHRGAIRHLDVRVMMNTQLVECIWTENSRYVIRS
ncbi:hypothetical protein E4U19_005908 [Claviceps sp. Clav32 group G5]|nr:hypothetical protein E4U19_005908 [Claviceps sp. Clav32 group G5]